MLALSGCLERPAVDCVESDIQLCERYRTRALADAEQVCRGSSVDRIVLDQYGYSITCTDGSGFGATE